MIVRCLPSTIRPFDLLSHGCQITSPFDYPKEHYEPYITFLREQYSLILDHEAVLEGMSVDQQMALSVYKKGNILRQLRSFERLFSEITWAKGVLRSSVDGKERKEEVIDQPSRYLCVSNGLEIWCLHLKQGNTLDLQQPPPLVKFAELNLTNYLSTGLFKLGSNAYMIGAKGLSLVQLPSLYPSDIDYCSVLWLTYSECLESLGIETYHLSMDAADTTPTLSLSVCGIGKLNYKKLWPIVEEIEGNIHMIDSIPRQLRSLQPGPIISHEVFTWGEGSWRVMSMSGIEDHDYITSHLVVGNRIYAVGDYKYMMFDSETSSWKASKKDSHTKQVWRDPFNVEQVWHILDLGMARCVGQFPLALGREQKEEQGPLYVVLTIVRKWRTPIHNRSNGMNVVAYLVTLTGRVLCYQLLPHFFEGQILQPSRMSVGTIFSFVEEGEKMFATVFNGKALSWGRSRFLFVNTFTVEVLTSAAFQVQQLWEERKEAGWPKEQEFVHVAVNGRYVYATQHETFDGKGVCCTYFPTLQACFL